MAIDGEMENTFRLIKSNVRNKMNNSLILCIQTYMYAQNLNFIIVETVHSNSSIRKYVYGAGYYTRRNTMAMTRCKLIYVWNDEEEFHWKRERVGRFQARNSCASQIIKPYTKEKQ